MPQTLTKLEHLAHQIALKLREEEDILADFGLSKEEFELLKTRHPFQSILEQKIIEWSSPLSTKKRAELEAQTLAREALPIIGARICDPKEPLSSAVDGLKTVCKIGGIGEDAIKQGAAGGQQVTVTLNIGGDQVVIEGGTTPAIEENSEPEIRLLPKREGTETPVLPEPERSGSPQKI